MIYVGNIQTRKDFNKSNSKHWANVNHGNKNWDKPTTYIPLFLANQGKQYANFNLGGLEYGWEVYGLSQQKSSWLR